MNEFFEAVRDPDLPFLRYALIAGVLSSISLGIVGSYVVTRRISYIAAAISHCILAGIGAALFFRHSFGWTWCDPLAGSLVAAILSAILIGFVSLYAKQREDTVISAVWSSGMAIGLLFLNKTPGFADPMSYLFGDILLLSKNDIYIVLGMDLIVLILGIGLYPKFLALCFDEEFAELRGVGVKTLYLLLLCLTAITVVLMVRIVGIVLVIALMTLAPAIAGHFSRKLWHMMIGAILLCALFIMGGIALSYPPNLPSGPVIILLAGGTYLVVALISKLLKK